MSPLQMIMLAAAAYFGYQYYAGDSGVVTTQPQPQSSSTGDANGVPISAQPVQQSQAQQIMNFADRLRAAAGVTKTPVGSFGHDLLNFHQWNYYAAGLFGGQGYGPEAFGVDGNALITADQYVSILGGSWPGTPAGMAGMGNFEAMPKQYLAFSDRGLGGYGASGWEKMVAKGRRIQ